MILSISSFFALKAFSILQGMALFPLSLWWFLWKLDYNQSLPPLNNSSITLRWLCFFVGCIAYSLSAQVTQTDGAPFASPCFVTSGNILISLSLSVYIPSGFQSQPSLNQLRFYKTVHDLTSRQISNVFPFQLLPESIGYSHSGLCAVPWPHWAYTLSHTDHTVVSVQFPDHTVSLLALPSEGHGTYSPLPSVSL